MDNMHGLGVILAGGKSNRMGSDKALRMLAGEPLVLHLLRRLHKQLGTVVINTASQAPLFGQLGVPLVPDIAQFAGKGPLAGIYSAMVYAQAAGLHAIITVAVDTPFFPPNYARRLLEKSAHHAGKPILARSENSWHPTFGLWPVSLHKALEQQLTCAHDNSIMAFARQHAVESVCFTADTNSFAADPFFNINTPDDLATAQTLMAHMKEKKP